MPAAPGQLRALRHAKPTTVMLISEVFSLEKC